MSWWNRWASRDDGDASIQAGKTPVSRVEAYIDDWHRQWTSARNSTGGLLDDDTWRACIEALHRRHFVPGVQSDLGRLNTAIPAITSHDPTRELIVSQHRDGDSARIDTESPDAVGLKTYHVYSLACDTDGNWLITSIRTLLNAPDAPLVPSERHADILALAQAAPPRHPIQHNLHLDEHRLFSDGRDVDIPDTGRVRSRMTSPGRIHLASGIIGIVDLGYDLYEPEPLAQCVAPGRYRVDIVSVGTAIAGVRVCFDETRQATHWSAACTPGGNGVFGVDAGNLAILDMPALLGMTFLDKEQVFSDWVSATRPALLALRDEPDCVITRSGYGDGAYPAIWGYCDRDVPVSLYIDYLVLVHETADGALYTA